MESSVLLIITYLIEHGGIFGLFVVLLTAYIAFKEYTFYKKIPENDTKISEISSKLDNIKEIHKNIISQNDNDDLSDINDKILNIQEDVSIILTKSIDLWDWHNIKDTDGVRNWYFRTSLQDSLDEIHNSIATLENNINEMHQSITILEANINDINDISKTNLDEKLQKINDKRVVELKTLLDTYNKTIIDLTLALEKIRAILKTKNEEI